MSISLAFAAIGSLLGGLVADAVGRKTTLHLTAIPLALGSALRYILLFDPLWTILLILFSPPRQSTFMTYFELPGIASTRSN